MDFVLAGVDDVDEGRDEGAKEGPRQENPGPHAAAGAAPPAASDRYAHAEEQGSTAQWSRMECNQCTCGELVLHLKSVAADKPTHRSAMSVTSAKMSSTTRCVPGRCAGYSAAEPTGIWSAWRIAPLTPRFLLLGWHLCKERRIKGTFG